MNKPVCMYCGKDVFPGSRGVYNRVQGWEEPRTQGGANQITLREVVPDTFACDACITRRRHGIADEQETMAL